MDSEMACKTFEMENSVVEISDEDSVYKFDAERDAKSRAEEPWKTDPHYFKKVKMSALALLKMVMHARSGGTIEVMGLMQGKIEGDTMVVMDAFALPVEGTETRVSAMDQGYLYMFAYQELIRKVGRLENVIGWYHSHPGYGCWLSGIDVSTQKLNQTGQDPFLAVVVDPTRTCSSGKVELGAFRTYPDGYKPPDAVASDYQTIPMEKIEDFGVHANSYYPLEVSYFKSSLDRTLLGLLWNKYWVNTLSASPLLANAGYTTGQIVDLANKLEEAERALGHSRHGYMMIDSKKKEDSALVKCSRDGAKTAIEVVHGLMGQILKNLIFNRGTEHSCGAHGGAAHP